jgi:hypothetical protein
MKYRFSCGCILRDPKRRCKKWWSWLEPCEIHAAAGAEVHHYGNKKHPTEIGAVAVSEEKA